MKKTFMGIIVLSSLSHFAAAESYTEKFYRKLTTAELSWAQKQEALKEVNCSEYLIKKTITTIDGFTILSEDMLFTKRPIFPQGKIVCSISPYNEENKEFSFSSEEQGTVDGVAYHLSHGRVVAGYIGDGLFSWEMECENRKSKNNDSSAKFCYVKDLQFYVQYIPELKEINVPKGYVISHGETHFSAITRFMVDKQEISINSKLPFIYGESAKEVFKTIKPTSTISYVAVNPLNNKESDYEVSGKMIEQLPAALKILERTWSLYKN
ncbi:TPA: hypothetical protein OT971_000795 [Escherichia coli]|nr:hypothetical protein [Escherichia coli]